MKKIFAVLMLFLIVGVVYGRTPTIGNMWNVTDYPGAYGAELNTDGSFVPMTSGAGALGTSTYKWDVVGEDATVDNLTVNTTISIPEVISRCDSWDNLVAKSSCVISGVAGGGISITTATCASDKFYVLAGDISQPAEAPRNISVRFDGGTASTATIAIEGLDARGNVIHESIKCVSEINYTNNAFSWVYGSTGTISVGGNASLVLAIGSGDIIGLMGDITSTAKVYGAKVRTSTTWASELSSLTIDATYNTWTHSDIPDGADDYMIFYRANSE